MTAKTGIAPDRSEQACSTHRPDRQFITGDPWRIIYFRQHVGAEVLIDDEGFWVVKAIEHHEPGVATITLSFCPSCHPGRISRSQSQSQSQYARRGGRTAQR